MSQDAQFLQSAIEQAQQSLEAAVADATFGGMSGDRE